MHAQDARWFYYFRTRCFPSHAQLVTAVAVALSAKILVGSSARWRPTFVSGALVALVTCEVSIHLNRTFDGHRLSKVEKLDASLTLPITAKHPALIYGWDQSV